MDLRRLRFGDWIMGLGGLAVLLVMFLDWYEPATSTPGFVIATGGDPTLSAWQAFAVNDVILAVAALTGIAGLMLAATQPTPAVPTAVASIATLLSVIALVLVTIRLIWPPDLDVAAAVGPELETARATGAWLGLVATALLAGGSLASIRDERVPRPVHQVEPRLVGL